MNTIHRLHHLTMLAIAVALPAIVAFSPQRLCAQETGNRVDAPSRAGAASVPSEDVDLAPPEKPDSVVETSGGNVDSALRDEFEKLRHEKDATLKKTFADQDRNDTRRLELLKSRIEKYNADELKKQISIALKAVAKGDPFDVKELISDERMDRTKEGPKRRGDSIITGSMPLGMRKESYNELKAIKTSRDKALKGHDRHLATTFSTRYKDLGVRAVAAGDTVLAKQIEREVSLLNFNFPTDVIGHWRSKSMDLIIDYGSSGLVANVREQGSTSQYRVRKVFKRQRTIRLIKRYGQNPIHSITLELSGDGKSLRNVSQIPGDMTFKRVRR